MNRKERRQSRAQDRAAGPGGRGVPASDAAMLYARAANALQSGRLPEAETLFQEVLRVDPGHADAHNWLGVVCQQKGDGGAAVEHLKTAVALRPASADFANNLGIAELKLGDLDAAERSFEKALVLNPRLAQAHYNLGLVFQKRREDARAIACFENAIELVPNYLEAHLTLGNVFGDGGRSAEAIAQYRKLTALAPGFARGWYNLGLALKVQGEFAEAAGAFERAIASDPRMAGAYNGLGTIHLNLGRTAAAAQCFERALALEPDSFDAHNNLGTALVKSGRASEAIPWFERALARNPNSAEAHTNLGTALYVQQRLDEATEHFHRAIGIAPDHADPMTSLGMICLARGKLKEAGAYFERSLAMNPDHAAAMQEQLGLGAVLNRETSDKIEAMLRESHMPLDERVAFHFVLGRVYDGLGDFARAFSNFEQGHTLLGGAQAFDPEGRDRHIASVIRVFDRDFFASRAGWGNDSELPIFIVGMPRSGTTLVEQILSAHPEVAGAGELPHIPEMTAALAGRFGLSAPYPDAAALLRADSARDLASGYLGRIGEDRDGFARVTDKLPGNYMHLGFIALLFPKARIIHCRRDPLDTCLSCYVTRFYQAHNYTHDLRSLGLYYRGYRRLMDHWRKLQPLQMFEVDYEDVIADQEGMSRRLIAYCGLEWDARCLEFHKSERPVFTASIAQVRRPIYKDSVGRWRHYEPFLKPLQAALEETQP